MRDNERSSEQQLIDIMFQVAYTIHDNPATFEEMEVPQLMEWVAKQLRGCGFETTPMGASWGVLTKINRS